MGCLSDFRILILSSAARHRPLEPPACVEPLRSEPLPSFGGCFLGRPPELRRCPGPSTFFFLRLGMPTPFGGLPMRSRTCHDGCACVFVGASATINWCVMRTSLWSMRARASMGLRLRCAHRRRPRAAHPVPSDGAAPSPTVATVDVQLSVHSR